MGKITISTGHPDAGRVYAEAYDAALSREAALREEIELAKQVQEATDAIVAMVDGQRDHWIEKCGLLKQRLTVAERRAGDLESALINVRETLGREYWDQYAGLDETRDILDAALKPAAEGEGS